MSPAEPELPFGCGGWVWKQKATLFGGSGLRTQLLSLAAADAPCSRQLYACTHWDGTHHPHRSLSPESQNGWLSSSPKPFVGCFLLPPFLHLLKLGRSPTGWGRSPYGLKGFGCALGGCCWEAVGGEDSPSLPLQG